MANTQQLLPAAPDPAWIQCYFSTTSYLIHHASVEEGEDWYKAFLPTARHVSYSA